MLDRELINLLSTHLANRLVADCFERISHGEEVRFGTATLLPLKRVIDLYTIRAGINSELNNGVVQGFDELLAALKTASGPLVKLNSLEFVSDSYLVFIDESTSDMLGILKTPKKKAAWFDPVTGYGE